MCETCFSQYEMCEGREWASTYEKMQGSAPAKDLYLSFQVFTQLKVSGHPVLHPFAQYQCIPWKWYVVGSSFAVLEPLGNATLEFDALAAATNSLGSFSGEGFVSSSANVLSFVGRAERVMFWLATNSMKQFTSRGSVSDCGNKDLRVVKGRATQLCRTPGILWCCREWQASKNGWQLAAIGQFRRRSSFLITSISSVFVIVGKMDGKWKKHQCKIKTCLKLFRHFNTRCIKTCLKQPKTTDILKHVWNIEEIFLLDIDFDYTCFKVFQSVSIAFGIYPSLQAKQNRK
jgi:hypothetical protein